MISSTLSWWYNSKQLTREISYDVEQRQKERKGKKGATGKRDQGGAAHSNRKPTNGG